MPENQTSTEVKFNSFAEFYPHYLREHRHPICRVLHYIGSILVLITLYLALSSGSYLLLCALPVIGYGFAWIGHFVVEKNRPATFTYPFYSFVGDWVMLKDFLTGQINKKLVMAGVVSSKS